MQGISIRKRLLEIASKAAGFPSTNKDLRSIRKEISEIKSFYENIIHGIPCGVWVTDSADRICFANKGMEMIAGITKQKLLGYNISESSKDSVTDSFMDHFIEAKKTLTPVYFSSIPVMTPAGKQTYQSGWFIPRKTRGKYRGMICILQDITNQQEMSRILKETQARYQDIVENVSSVIMRTDTKGTITFFNTFAQGFLGYSETEILGKEVLYTILQDNKANRDTFMNLLRGICKLRHHRSVIELASIKKNREVVWIAWTAKAVLDEKGTPSEILWVGNDITELKLKETLLEKSRTELEQKVQIRTAELQRANIELQREIDERKWVHTVLRKSQEKYRLLVENANEGIIVIQDNFIKFGNPKALKITGYDEKTIMERPFFEIFHPEDRDLIVERYLKRLKGYNVPNIYSCRIIDREGCTKWIELNSVLISWMGRPAALVFFNNITERKVTEERLRLLESAIQQTKDSIIITTARPEDFSSRIVFVNESFTKITGYTAEDVIGRLSVILQGPKTDSTEWFKLESPHSKVKTFQFETLATRKDGTKFDLEWQISPIRDEKGKITHFISTQRDITERKQTERALNNYQEQLRLMAYELSLTEERERRIIAANLHDHIGQLLAILKIRLGVLKDSITEECILRDISSMRSIVEKAIVFTKNLTFELSPPVLYELGFEAALEWLCEKMQRDYNITFQFNSQGDIKTIDTNISIMMFRATRELCINAIKHGNPDMVSVRLIKKEDYAQIRVSDNGSGFMPELVNRSNTFGLFSIRERLKHIGGDINIDSKIGEGALVTLTFPLEINSKGK